MSDTEQAFAQASVEVKQLTKKPSNEQLLKLYALFKQGSEGDNSTKKPGLTDLVGKAKWNAWNDLKGTPTADAQAKYIALVSELKATLG
ncbi:acyl-CoA-binding protein [Nocardia mangyaensis]|uniref:Acyl-CoA-binding protein n=1 Tax=Nocardia mangyaensis TaxID=2213200 RepID=A0A1J0VQ53_9NOCA|nr:acyl-CoA-binding protein [Nocardia mangyaensis]APE34184.1 acyl-CoA-binding protein [Nocardia mangyaensis]